MINKLKKYKILLNIAFFLAIVMSVIFFVAVPIIGKIKNQANEIQQRTTDAEISQARLAKLPEMEKRHEAFASQQKNLEVIINANQEVELIKKLESLAEETGNKITLTINDVTGKTQQKKDKGEDIKSSLPYDNFIVMQLSLEGYYDGFINFIHKLENLNNFVNITAIGLTKIQAESQNNNGSIDPASSETTLNKEILKSTVEVVVYIKK